MWIFWAIMGAIFVPVVAAAAHVTLRDNGRYRHRPGIDPGEQGYQILSAEYRSGPEPGAEETSRYWHVPKDDQAYAKIFVPPGQNKD